ncbi:MULTISPECIES: DsbE family thiol:disulfide interchange protein [Halomonadaceae]|uniref:DsbE family thiol:disulfide interchange protein n=1 Tax=Billgrantia desiderata TaxID=52021 RepID=A0AAW4YRD7_9GAMM|nr:MULTISPECIES: DsbE family thiol:disulfide interchange protein [Halomonas]MCE8030133.1 DsbE family thiol:disulfide interchange protein [Halomonas desiderata]MCE8037895.1 DsbE family thiol:disulfide interchange protein [Halomonas sp. MCCC 1A11062]MCE8042635.1 DsbE family thiol:disulfide interchange protein [Halomonas desiderata]MCE8047210.1 DsbE family thiol:disulfide interchange protein [Halomonas desiderata]MCE8050531.1 DsbE family thiol:disulfide interchange protein [Halomonas desiderata]
MTRRLILLLPLIGFLVLSLFLYQGLSLNPFHRESALMARDFPEFNLPTLEDPERRVDRSLLQTGELTLVNVWGEWCPECKREMPQLLDLADRGIRMVGVNWKDTREKGLGFLEDFGNPFETNIFDPDNELGFELGVFGAPETFLVDRDGIIRYHHTGYISASDVREHILPEVQKWQ